MGDRGTCKIDSLENLLCNRSCNLARIFAKRFFMNRSLERFQSLCDPLGKPLTSTLLTSTFVFRSGGFPFQGFELEWSLVATSLKGFSVTGHEKGVPGAPFKGINRVRGAPPGTKIQSGHVKSGL